MSSTVLSEAQRLYTTAYSRWCHELSHDKNVTTAKDIAMYLCDQLTEATNWAGVIDDEIEDNSKEFWIAVKNTIEQSNHLELYKP